MKTRDKQGSFILLIRTLIAKVKELTEAPTVLLHPRDDLVADLFLRPVVCRSMQRRRADEARLSNLVFRYSSPRQCIPSSSFSLLQGARVTHTLTPTRRAK
jgi:hypothetical protein